MPYWHTGYAKNTTSAVVSIKLNKPQDISRAFVPIILTSLLYFGRAFSSAIFFCKFLYNKSYMGLSLRAVND